MAERDATPPRHPGRRNSSLTRVRPFFGPLLADDPTGRSWLPKLLAACPNRHRLPRDVIADPGALGPYVREKRPYSDKILGPLELVEAFEHQVPPPRDFLRHLLENPAELRWPLVKGERRTYSARTERYRTDLIDGHDEVRATAAATGLAELDKGVPTDRPTKWWMFEGFTEVDCLLATDKLVLFVEGKRKEVLSDSTSWYPGRNQLARNLEAVGELADGRACGVLLAVEHHADEIAVDVLDRSLPHLTHSDRRRVEDRFLGQVTWSDLCKAVGAEFSTLPETLTLTQATIDQYLSTLISVDVPGQRWQAASTAARLTQEPLFVLTAWNPGAERPPSNENRRRNGELRDRLFASTSMIWGALGSASDGSHEEESFAVAGIPLPLALRIGRDFGQAAIFELTVTEQIVHGCDASWARRRAL